jgi:hypothetical protein
MGVLWWAGGAATLFSLLHRPDQRTPLPALVIFFTGVGMVAHHQRMVVGVMTHAWFGKALMAAAGVRLIEMALEEGGLGKITAFSGSYAHRAASGGNIIPHRYQESRILPMLRRLSGLLMIISGLLFCGSTEQALASVASNELDVVTYMNGIISLGFALLAYVEGLIYVYKQCRMARRKQLGLPKAENDEDETIIYDTTLFSAGNSIAYNPLCSPSPSASTHVLFNDDDDGDNDDDNAQHHRQQTKTPVRHATVLSNIQVLTEEYEMESHG